MASAAERAFIRDAVADDVRVDGRARTDFRPFTLKTSVVTQANGSARFKIDSTEVIVAVNAEIDRPDPLKPKLGKIVCSVECSSAAVSEIDGQKVQNWNALLSSELQKLLDNSSFIPLQALCLVPGKSCWTIYVDAVVLDSSGNTFDAITMACRAALLKTRFVAFSTIPCL